MSWPTARLEEMTERARSITYGVVKPGPEDNENGVRFVRGGDIKDGKIAIGSLRTITEAVSKPYSRTLLRGGEILVSLVGNPGEAAVVPDELAGANIARQAGMIALRSEFNAKFVEYFLRSPRGRSELFQRTKGSVQQVINLADLKTVQVPQPNEVVQKRIASVLSAYDDLIENNRRRIALLEEAARLLYREWFVHFRFPGHEHVKIVDAVPEGWEIKKVGDLLARVKTKTKIRKDEYLEDGDYPCVDQGQNFIGGYTDNSEAIYRDELPLIVFGDHTRALKFVDFPFARGADGTQICHSNDERLSQEMFYWALVNVDLSNYFYARHFKFLKDQEVIIPSQPLADDFTRFSRDNFKQVKALRQQSAELAKARDLLLPRLMDGRLEV